MTATKTHVGIRWAIRHDLPEMLAIEAASHAEPWDRATFERVMQGRHTCGLVAESGDAIVGFMVYEFHQHFLEIHDLAIRPDFRRRGVGRQFVSRLIEKLDGRKRSRIKVLVPDTTPEAHYFLRACGFRATSVRRGYFGSSDAYTFIYRSAPVPVPA